jgi:hypothetical protein
MSAYDPKATSADTINFARRGKHEAAGVSLDTRLGSAAEHDNATTIIGQATIAALSIRRTY